VTATLTTPSPETVADLLSVLTGMDNPSHTAVERATRSDYPTWRAHAARLKGCTKPVRITGSSATVDTRTGEVIDHFDTAALPDGVAYKPCNNRRASVCPSCADTYRWDTYHLIAAGLRGGKGVPDSVAAHPAVFVTLTAPSFGPVHARVVRTHSPACRTGQQPCSCSVEPCRPRRDNPLCPHGRRLACFAKHHTDDPCIGRPLCLDCYDHTHQAVWNQFAPVLWSRTMITLARLVRKEARRLGGRAVLRYAKVAEYQRRGVVHLHVLMRLDGRDPDDPTVILPPPARFTADLLTKLVYRATTGTALTTPPHPDRPRGWPLTWGAQVDVRTVRRGVPDADVTERHVAGYLAKYATKSTEPVGLVAGRITPLTVHRYNDAATHTGRLIAACWYLGRPGADPETYGGLRRWAHMLGFGGHFSTKSRRYSITLGTLRAARRPGPRTGPASTDPAGLVADGYDVQAVEVIGTWTYVGSGWLTSGDAALAAQAADLARSRPVAVLPFPSVPSEEHP
jgi:hypothetical protein